MPASFKNLFLKRKLSSSLSRARPLTLLRNLETAKFFETSFSFRGDVFCLISYACDLARNPLRYLNIQQVAHDSAIHPEKQKSRMWEERYAAVGG